MSAPKHHLNACLEVIRDGLLQARAWGWSGNVPAEQLADLMDALHDIPTHIQHWDDVGDGAVKEKLRRYDEKWPKSVDSSNGLLELYERIRSRV